MSGECPETPLPDTGVDLVREMNRRGRRDRVPLSGTMALTDRCNLRCVHCYIPPAAVGTPAGRAGAELGTDAWLRLLDEVAEAGCLNLLLTGGEPLLRRDFGALFTRAKRNGMLTTVFTNGTLVDDAVLEAFAAWPPRAVEVSLYGATEATYEAVTGVPGSYRKCRAGIDALLASGVPLRLKTMLLRPNRHEFDAMAALAKSLGVKFRHDPSVFPRFDGDPGPTRLRVPPEEAVAIEMADPERVRDWARFRERTGKLAPQDQLYTCGAGRVMFHLDPHGTLRPCLMVRNLAANVSRGGFARAWREVMPRLADRAAPPGFRCRDCGDRIYCGYCPAFFELETGSETKYPSYLCRLGELRAEAVHRFLAEETR